MSSQTDYDSSEEICQVIVHNTENPNQNFLEPDTIMTSDMDAEEVRIWYDKHGFKLIELNEFQLKLYFNQLCNKWKLPETTTNLERYCKEKFGITDYSGLTSHKLFSVYNRFLTEASNVKLRYIIKCGFTDIEYENTDYMTSDDAIKWAKIFYSLFYMYEIVKNCFALNCLKDPEFTPDTSENEYSIDRFSYFTPYAKNTTQYQKLIRFLLHKLNSYEGETLALYKGNVFRKVNTPNGDFTFSWKSFMPIKSFINHVCNSNNNGEQWQNLVGNGNNNITTAEKYLNEYVDNDIIMLKKNRHMFSFNNGIWLTRVNVGTKLNPTWTDKFIKYSDVKKNLDYFSPKEATAKYFNCDFNNFDHLHYETFEEFYDNCFDEMIKCCPNFKSILDNQEFTKEVQFYMCVFIGRNLYDVKDLDAWQVFMYLLGQGGSGKSTIVDKVISNFYESEDVKQLSNNIERKFGMKPLANAFIVTAPEIMDNFKLEQTEWQLMVEGASNTYAEKNKNSETVTWKAPVPMAGNTLPDFKNNSGQVSRRLVVWRFWKRITKTDTQLDKKLEKEIPIIMKLCCNAYLLTVNKFPGKSPHQFLPKYFEQTRSDMNESSNSLISFLKSGNVRIGSEFYVTEKTFKLHFNEYCKENNIKKEKFDIDFYTTPFQEHGIEVKKGVTKNYPIGSDVYVKGTFYIGVTTDVEVIETTESERSS